MNYYIFYTCAYVYDVNDDDYKLIIFNVFLTFFISRHLHFYRSRIRLVLRIRGGHTISD